MKKFTSVLLAALIIGLTVSVALVPVFAENGTSENLKTFTCEKCGKEFQISEAEQQLGDVNDIDNSNICPSCLNKSNKRTLTQAQLASLTVLLQMADLRAFYNSKVANLPSGQNSQKSGETDNTASVKETENTNPTDEVTSATVPVNNDSDDDKEGTYGKYPLAASTINNVSNSTFVIVIIGTLIIGLGIGFIVSMFVFKKKPALTDGTENK